MTFAQILKAIHVKRVSKNLDTYLAHYTVVVKFTNPDKSSNDVTLRAGYVTRVAYFSTGMNRAAAEEEDPDAW